MKHDFRWLRRMQLLVLGLLLIVAMSGCSFNRAQELFDSRTDTLTHAPFYVTYAPHGYIIDHASVACPDIAIEPRTIYTFGLVNGREVSFNPLLNVMNAYLHRSGLCTRFAEWENLAEGAPDVYAGSGEAENAPQAVQRDQPDSRPPMILTTTYASDDWRDTYKQSEPRDPQYVLVIHLGIAEYPKSPRLLFDEKVVLGTHAEQDLSFLGRSDVPVEVVHVTAMLLDRDGNVLRAGSEGISAKRGHLIADLLGFTEITANYELGTLPTEPRTDMPGHPFKWQVALDNLLDQILAPN